MPADPASPSAPEAHLARYRATGDPAAFGAVFDATSGTLFRIALTLVRDPVAAEDVLQQTYAIALRKLVRLSDGRPVMPWLVNVLRKEAAEAVRQSRRRPDPRRLLDSRPPAGDPSAEERDTRDRVLLAVHGLEEPYRSAALLRWHYGLEPAEIAHVRGEPPGTTRSILSRALERLRIPLGSLPAAFFGNAAVPRGLARVRAGVVSAAASPAPAGLGAIAAAIEGILVMKKTLLAALALLALIGGYFALRPSAGAGKEAGGANPLLASDGGGPASSPESKPALLAAAARSDSAKPSAPSGSADIPQPPETAEAAGTAPAHGGAVLRGRVVSGDVRLPAAHATVLLLRPDALFKYLRAPREGRFDELRVTTDGEGRFAFRDVLPASGYALLARRSGGAAATSQGLDLGSRQTMDVGDLVLGPSGGLSGHVVDADGKPIGAARVSVTWAIRNEFGVVLADPDTLPWTEFETKTDAAGAWSALALEPGEKTVVVKAPSGAATVISPVHCPDGGVESGVDATLGGAMAISGRVVWSDGTPLVGASVFAMAPPKPAARTADTGGDGSFRIDGLGAGTYMMGVLVAKQPVQLLAAVAGGKDDVRIEFPVTGSLSGRVVEASTGKPVTIFRIRPQFAGEQSPMEKFVTERVGRVRGAAGFSSDEGAFRFEGLRPGRYVLAVEAEGYPRTESAAVTIEPGREVVAPPIELPSGHSISGVVTDAAGWPVADARIYVRADQPSDAIVIEEIDEFVANLDEEARTDASGVFRTRPLTPAAYLVGAVAKARLPVVRSGVDARAGDVLGLRLEMPAGGRIRIHAIDSRGGAPGSPVDLLLCNAKGEALERSTNAAGFLDAGPLGAGPWLVVRAGLAATAAAGEGANETRYEKLRAIPGTVELALTEGSALDATIRVPRLAVVRGAVRSKGRPAAGTVLLAAPGGFESEDAAADADGRFAIRRVEPGVYTVFFRNAEGSRDKWISAGSVEVPDADEHTLDVNLP